MSIRAFSRLSAAALVLGASLVATSARAEVTDGSGNIEVYAGWYFPDDSGAGADYDDLTAGLRLGYVFTKHLGLQATLGWFEGDGTYTHPAYGKQTISPSIVPLDISLMGYINPDSRAVFTAYGGIGYAFQDADVDVNCNVLPDPVDDLCRADKGARESHTDDSFTLHAGVGAKIDVTESFYLRPDARVRWFEDREDNEMDWEVSLGFGWWLGR